MLSFMEGIHVVKFYHTDVIIDKNWYLIELCIHLCLSDVRNFVVKQLGE